MLKAIHSWNCGPRSIRSTHARDARRRSTGHDDRARTDDVQGLAYPGVAQRRQCLAVAAPRRSPVFLTRSAGSASLKSWRCAGFLYYLYGGDSYAGPRPRRSASSRDHSRRQPPLRARARGAGPQSGVRLWAPKSSTTSWSGAPRSDPCRQPLGVLDRQFPSAADRGLRNPLGDRVKAHELARQPSSHRLGLRVRAVGKLDLLPDSTIAAIRPPRKRPRAITRWT
jgi:hypothetical protein